MDFVIHYGVRAGFEEQALALARRLFAHFDEAIDSLALIPIAEDDFDLVLDGRTIASYQHLGRAPALLDVALRLQASDTRWDAADVSTRL